MRFPRLETVLANISPMAAISRVGVSITHGKDGLPRVMDPEPMIVTPWGFVCEDKLSMFKGGHVLSWFQYISGRKPWGISVRELCGMFKNELAPHMADEGWEMSMDSLALECKAQRAPLNQLIRMFAKPPIAGNARTARAISRLTALGINHLALGNRACIAGAEDMIRLADLVASCGGKPGSKVADSSSLFLVMPSFLNHHTVSKVAVMGLSGEKVNEVDLWRLEPAGMSWFNLWDVHTLGKHTRVVMSPIDAMKESHGAVGLAAGADGDPVHFVPEEPLAVWRGKDDTQPITALARHAASLKIVKGAVKLTWDGFCEMGMVDTAREGTTALSHFMDMTCANPEAREKAIKALRAKGDEVSARHIEARAGESRRLRFGNKSIWSARDGWRIRDDKSGSVTRASNFSVSLDTLIVYPGEDAVCHHGKVMMDGETRPLTARAGSLDRASELVRVATEAWCAGGNVVDTPRLLDKTSGPILTQAVCRMAEGLKVEEGIPHLGWSRDRQVFFGSSWYATRDGVTGGVRHRLPGVDAFSVFAACEAPDPSATIPDIKDGVVRDFISQVVGVMARTYAREQTKPIRVRNTPSTRTALAHMLGALGQTVAIDLNPNTRATREPSGLGGHPVWCAGYTRGQAERSTLPAVLVVDSGVQLPDAGLEEAALALRIILARCAIWLAKTGGADFSREHSVSWECELLKEGARIVRLACGIVEWPLGSRRHDALEAMLSSMSHDNLASVFSYDLRSQTVRANLTARSDAADVAKDLSSVCDRCHEESPGLVVLDALSAMSMLENFYGRPPRMPNVQPAVTGRPSQVSSDTTSAISGS